MIVHATNNAVARKTSILAAVVLLLMPAPVKAAVGIAGLFFAAPYALFTLHACFRPSGGRLSRFFFPATKSGKLQERLKALDR